MADIEPAFFVGHLHRVKATGTLKFHDVPFQRAIYFREGRILFSSSNAPEDQLGAILISGGKISQEQFDNLVANLVPKQSIAAALAQGGHLAQRDIGDAARRKVEQIVGSCCVQTGGTYEFEDGVLPKGALDLKLTTERVLVSAFEALEPSGVLMRILKSPMAVLVPADVVPDDPDLARLREALDGFSTLADAGGQVGLSPAATEARAAVLVVLGSATVATSQIEEMALPDTGEASLELSEMSAQDSLESFEADTIAFGESASDPDQDSSADPAVAVAPSQEDPLPDSGDATLVMPSGLDLSPGTPNDNGVSWGGGPRKASTQDLAAVKELIGTPASTARPKAASSPADQWKATLSLADSSADGRSGLGGFGQNPFVRSAAVVVLVAVVALAAWVGYSNQFLRPSATAAGPVASTPSPGLPVSAPSIAAPIAAELAPLPGPSPAATPPAVSAPRTAAPKTSAAQPPPAASASRPAAVVPVSSNSAYETMKSGRLTEAASVFEQVARSSRAKFSVQLVAACSPQTIAKAIQNDPSTDLYILPATIASKPCYRIMRGFFATRDEATRAVSTLPTYYTAEGAKPRAVAIRSVLR